jgi:hypothetical protein
VAETGPMVGNLRDGVRGFFRAQDCLILPLFKPNYSLLGDDRERTRPGR